MSINLSAVAVTEFDSMVKHAYANAGLLKNAVTLRNNVVGDTYKFRRMGKGLANQKASSADVTPMNVGHEFKTATLANWNAPEFTDIFDAQEVNFDEKQELASTIAGALGRRCDQLVIDAMDASTPLTTAVPAGGTNLTIAKVNSAQVELRDQGVPNTELFAVIEAGGLVTDFTGGHNHTQSGNIVASRESQLEKIALWNKFWNKNCVAIGLASGFLEPVESTAIHLIMSAVLRLMRLFPHDEISQSNIDEYNRQYDNEMERIRDFIILHYKATEREDTPFWSYCKQMDIPDTLAHRIKLFKDTARVCITDTELFRIDSWTQVMIGQRIIPENYHQIVDMMSDEELNRFLSGLKNDVSKKVAQMPTHQEFINQYCKAQPI